MHFRTHRRCITIPAIIALTILMSGCFHVAQETTCKFKFKKKYDCPFSEITTVENQPVLGDQLLLRGCGKFVTYNGTKEILVEDR